MEQNDGQTGQRYVDLLSDAGFKAVFGDERNSDVIIDFLNVVLEGERKVVSFEYSRNEIPGLNTTAKGVRYDLICKDPDGTQFVVEMQKRKDAGAFFDRSVFYAATLYSRQLPSGADYSTLKPAYVIGIMEDELAHEKEIDAKRILSRYAFVEKESGIVAPQTIMLNFVQLNNFKLKAEQCKNSFDQWCYTCKHSKMLKDRPEVFKDEKMQRLYDACEIAQFDKGKQLEYFKSIMLEVDYLYDMRISREEGLAEGLAEGEAKGKAEGLAEGEAKGKAEGLAEGKAEGKAEGLAEGEAKGKAEIARNLKAMSMPIEQIVTATGLTAEQINAL